MKKARTSVRPPSPPNRGTKEKIGVQTTARSSWSFASSRMLAGHLLAGGGSLFRCRKLPFKVPIFFCNPGYSQCHQDSSWLMIEYRLHKTQCGSKGSPLPSSAAPAAVGSSGPRSGSLWIAQVGCSHQFSRCLLVLPRLPRGLVQVPPRRTEGRAQAPLGSRNAALRRARRGGGAVTASFLPLIAPEAYRALLAALAMRTRAAEALPLALAAALATAKRKRNTGRKNRLSVAAAAGVAAGAEAAAAAAMAAAGL